MRKPRVIDVPSTQQIEALYEAGDYEQLRAINEKLAKVANQRMKQLEKSGISRTHALDRAQYYLSEVSEIAKGGKFSRSKKADIDEIVDQIQEMSIFIKDKTSTVSGEKERRSDKMFESLTTGIKRADKIPKLLIPEDIEVPADWQGTRNEYFKEKFLSFLDSKMWDDIKKFQYSEDTNVLQEAGDALAKGAKLSDLKKAYRQYLEGEVTMSDMWASWTSIT